MTMTSALNMTLPLEIGIGCDDLPSMRRFYEDTLGLQLVSEARVPAEKAHKFGMSRGSLTVLRLQTPYGERIKLIGLDEPPPRDRHRGDHVFDDARVSYLTFIITDIAATLERLLAGGATAISGDNPIESRPGLQIAFLRDPQGNVLELVQYDDVAAYRPDLVRP
jgi:lactoylglutathione lyase